MIIYYTYLIGWTKHNKWYYGSQYGRKSNPSNLWTTYFTSSKKVKEFRNKYGDPDVIQIRKTFQCSSACRNWEYKVLTRIRAAQKDIFLNATNSKGISNEEMLLQGKHPSQNPEALKKMSNSLKGKLSGDRNPAKREDVKIKLRVPKSEEHKRKISEGHKRRKEVECPHCKRASRASVFPLFHWENCKLKPSRCEGL